MNTPTKKHKYDTYIPPKMASIKRTAWKLSILEATPLNAWTKRHFTEWADFLCACTDLETTRRLADIKRQTRYREDEEFRKYRLRTKNTSAQSVKDRYIRENNLYRANVSWADAQKVADFYILRDKLTKETGIQHHVDHIIPLKAKRHGKHIASGLHNEFNLRVITKDANLQKSCNIDK